MFRPPLITPILAALLSFALGCTAGSEVSRRLGARCEAHDQCDDLCLADPEFPDGFCSVSCNFDDDCPARSACVDHGEGVCLFRCFEPTDCDFLGPGWQCAVAPGLPSGQESVCTGP